MKIATTKPISKATAFVSHAHVEKQLAHDLVDRLAPRLKIRTDCDIDLFIDDYLLAGERLEERIIEAATTANAGLLLLSPGFLASSFIREHEVPEFVERIDKIALPVMLKPVALGGGVDLQGIGRLKIYRYLDARYQPKTYDQLRGPNRDRFADGVVDQLVGRVIQGPTS